MKDILGREINEGDVVVIKGSGGAGGSAKPMAVGIFYKKSVRLVGGGHRSARDMFLVENPGKVEQDIKDTILKELEAEKKAAAVRAQTKKAQQANVVGRVYQVTKESTVFLYVGEKRVRRYLNGKLISEEIGNMYIECGYARGYRPLDPKTVDFKMAKARVEEALTSWGGDRYEIIKGFKSYAQEFQDVDVPREFEISGTHNWKVGRGSYGVETQWEEHNDKIQVIVTDIYK